jgi:hypothetical protein
MMIVQGLRLKAICLVIFCSSTLGPAWAIKSKLPKCPTNEFAVWDNCVGTIESADGTKYSGEFREDMRDGFGTLTFPNGDKYVGEFKRHNFNGKGTLYSARGKVKRSGFWEDESPANFIEEKENPTDDVRSQDSGQSSSSENQLSNSESSHQFLAGKYEPESKNATDNGLLTIVLSLIAAVVIVVVGVNWKGKKDGAVSRLEEDLGSSNVISTFDAPDRLSGNDADTDNLSVELINALERLAALRTKGIITDEEFVSEKNKIIAGLR